MKLESLRDLYVEQLKDLYSAETQLVRALPKIAEAASAPKLRTAFQQHLEQTKHHAKRLEQVFDRLEVGARGKKCKAMEGLIVEGEEVLTEDTFPEVRDAALIAAAQRIEHYEIAGYGTVRTYAILLGDEASVKILQQTLDEEGEADKKLTQLAEQGINAKAEASDNTAKV